MIEERTLQGYWWDPRDPLQRIAGVLTITERGSATLSLNGAFDPGPLTGMPPEIPEVLGETSDALVTLGQCIPTHKGGRSYVRIDYHVSTVYLGDHLINASETPFKELEFRLDHMMDWVGTTDLRYAAAEPTWEPGMVGAAAWFDYSLESTAMRGTGSYALRKEYQLERSGDSVAIRESALFRVVSSHRITAHDFTSEFVSPLRDLLSFAADKAVAPSIVTLRKDAASDRILGPVRPSSVELVREFIAPPTYDVERYLPNQMLFTFPDCDQGLQALLDGWYRLLELTPWAINVLVGDLYGPATFVDNRLLLLLLAGEAYHRGALPGSQVDDDNLVHRNAALASCEPGSREWLTQRLQHAEEPGYRKRLKELIRRAKPAIDPLIPSVGTVADQLYNARNAGAHPGTGTLALVATGMYRLAETFHWVLKINILRDLGFSAARIGDLLTRNASFSHLAGRRDTAQTV